MSLLTHPSSPFSNRPKRFLEDNENFDIPLQNYHTPHKRTRFQVSPRCGNYLGESFRISNISLSTISVLHSLFPRMDEQTIRNVLSEYGDNIDAAIKRLGQLSLSNDGISTVPHVPEPVTLRSAPEASTATTTAEASGTSFQGPITREQWAEAIVQEISTAKDLLEAKTKAANVLEQCLEREMQPISAKHNEMLKENFILRRGLQIQTGRYQEMQQQLQTVAAAQQEENHKLRTLVSQHQHEDQKLRAVVAQYEEQLSQSREQIRVLENNNFRLRVYLEQSSNQTSIISPKNPDVF